VRSSYAIAVVSAALRTLESQACIGATVLNGVVLFGKFFTMVRWRRRSGLPFQENRLAGLFRLFFSIEKSDKNPQYNSVKIFTSLINLRLPDRYVKRRRKPRAMSRARAGLQETKYVASN